MPSVLSKVSIDCTLDQLREEAEFRRLNGNIPFSKSMLIAILGEGSIRCKAVWEASQQKHNNHDDDDDDLSLHEKLAAFPPTISKQCTVRQLREEAEFRKYKLGNVPLTKAMWLEILGDGSTSCKATALAALQGKKNPVPKTSKKKKKKKRTECVMTSPRRR